MRGGEVEVLGIVARGLGPRGSLGLAGGLGLDGRFVDTTPLTGTTLANRQSVRELALFLRTAVRFDFRLHGPLSLFAALTLDLFPVQGRLLVRHSGAARAVFTPWPLRPGALDWRLGVVVSARTARPGQLRRQTRTPRRNRA